MRFYYEIYSHSRYYYDFIYRIMQIKIYLYQLIDDVIMLNYKKSCDINKKIINISLVLIRI